LGGSRTAPTGVFGSGFGGGATCVDDVDRAMLQRTVRF
jgi:hypothetical protein